MKPIIEGREKEKAVGPYLRRGLGASRGGTQRRGHQPNLPGGNQKAACDLRGWSHGKEEKRKREVSSNLGCARVVHIGMAILSS